MAASDTESPHTDILSGPDVATRVMHGSLQRAGGFAAINLITAFAAVLLLRQLGVANFGRFGTVMALLSIVQGVSDAGLSMTGSRELSIRVGDQARRDLLAHLVGLRIILSGIGVVLAVGFATVAGYSQTLIEGTALAGGGVFVLSVQGSLLLPLSVELQNWRLTINDVMRQFVLVLCYAILAIAGASLLPFFAAQLVAGLAVLALTPLLLARRQLVRPRWKPAQLRLLAISTLPLAVSGVLSVLYFRILVVLMSLLEPSATQVGYYVTSARVMEIFLALPVMLIGVVLPVLSVSSRNNAGRLNYVTLRMTQMLCLVGVLLAVILGTGARPIILILGGKTYLGAASVLQIQCFALITIFVTAAWSTTLVSMGRPRALAVATVTGVAAVLISGLALIPPLGAKGAGIAAVAGDVILCGAMYHFVRSAGAGNSLHAGPFIRIALCALPALALAVVSPLSQTINCILATILFCALTIPLKAMPPELAQLLLGLVGRGRGLRGQAG